MTSYIVISRRNPFCIHRFPFCRLPAWSEPLRAFWPRFRLRPAFMAVYQVYPAEFGEVALA